MGTSGGAFSWNSELSSGHSPFWIRDDALVGLGLHAGDAVSVDTSAEPRDGDVVVVEAEVEGDSIRTARRYFASGERVRLEPVGDTGGVESLDLPAENVIVMGVIVARLRFSGDQAFEEPLA